MLLFLSDLHLTDTTDRSTVDLTRLSEALDSLLSRAIQKKGVQEVTLVLLGDVFELLKSRAWRDRQLRPWEAVTAAHTRLVTEILDSIVEANLTFWEDLRRLNESYSLKLEFLPGNHDLYLNKAMGEQARRRFQDLLRRRHCPLPWT